MAKHLSVLTTSFLLLRGVLGAASCKTTPHDAAWPTNEEWAELNKTIDGTLLRTVPAASSCWPGNPFDSPISCDVVKGNWTSGVFHAALPESIDYPLYANNSCLPPGASGYDESKGCDLGGLPEYIVNATTEQHVATAMKWASQRNIRITVKGTGHDMNGRSSGAYSLSIWTRNFNHIEHLPIWTLPDNTTIAHAVKFGSGNGWGAILTSALARGRVVTTGQDPSVGPGGWTQGGGHGPLSRTYGLGAHQVLQATIVTPDGAVLIANDQNNTDIFWALRGGGAGQYGVVTEYVFKTHPAPLVTTGTVQLAPLGEAGANASYEAVATLFAHLPDLMDAGLAGAASLATGESALKFSPALKAGTAGIAGGQVFWAFNMSTADLSALVEPVVQRMRACGTNATLSVTFSASNQTDYRTFYSSISGSDVAGSSAVMSSRLVGRRQLVETPRADVVRYLRTALRAQNQTAGTYITVGLQGGPGVADVEEERWGSVNPVWRDTYLHVIATGADMDNSKNPKQVLADAADWMEDVKEAMWREWSPEMGAYMNEANPYNSEWKHDFYGAAYERLLEIKRKYDPTESMYVLNGVGTENWEYDLNTGKLCKTT
ncbi:FAD linked oxidase [Macrophomina phaseolina MS6]|uniref:FAD linked oxidase n=1 Tax=Macrophomina phaseolina (strain MS6) TaxID=1126212 RepID=K2RYF6_MACPH|nr:FAD linked oxidase [Macrophomina phaseolina MS6]